MTNTHIYTHTHNYYTHTHTHTHTLIHHTHLQYAEHRFQLILPQLHVGADLSQTVDGLQPDQLNLVVEHVHEVVKALHGKGGAVHAQTTH